MENDKVVQLSPYRTKKKLTNIQKKMLDRFRSLFACSDDKKPDKDGYDPWKDA